MNRRSFIGWCAGAVTFVASGLVLRKAVAVPVAEPKLTELKWKRVWVRDQTLAEFPKHQQPDPPTSPYFGGIVFYWRPESWVETTYNKIKRGDIFDVEGEEQKVGVRPNGPYTALTDAFKKDDGVNWWWTCETEPHGTIEEDINLMQQSQAITPNEVRAMRGQRPWVGDWEGAKDPLMKGL